MRFVLQLLLVAAVAATGSHGPADVELHDTATGRLIQSVRAYSENLPNGPNRTPNELATERGLHLPSALMLYGWPFSPVGRFEWAKPYAE